MECKNDPFSTICSNSMVRSLCSSPVRILLTDRGDADSSTYSASAGGGNSESFHDQSHDQINYASYQTSPFSDSIELLHRDSIMSHPDLTSFTPQTNPNPRQSAEIKRLWTDLEQSEKMREMAVGEVERLRMIAKDAESVFAREQRRVEMELRNEVEILSRQLQSIRGILS